MAKASKKDIVSALFSEALSPDLPEMTANRFSMFMPPLIPEPIVINNIEKVTGDNLELYVLYKELHEQTAENGKVDTGIIEKITDGLFHELRDEYSAKLYKCATDNEKIDFLGEKIKEVKSILDLQAISVNGLILLGYKDNKAKSMIVVPPTWGTESINAYLWGAALYKLEIECKEELRKYTTPGHSEQTAPVQYSIKKLKWVVENNRCYHVFNKLKDEGLITGTDHEIGQFIYNHIEFKTHPGPSEATIIAEFKRNKQPAKQKRFESPPEKE